MEFDSQSSSVPQPVDYQCIFPKINASSVFTPSGIPSIYTPLLACDYFSWSDRQLLNISEIFIELSGPDWQRPSYRSSGKPVQSGFNLPHADTTENPGGHRHWKCNYWTLSQRRPLPRKWFSETVCAEAEHSGIWCPSKHLGPLAWMYIAYHKPLPTLKFKRTGIRCL